MTEEQKNAILRNILSLSETLAQELCSAQDKYSSGLRQLLDSAMSPNPTENVK